MSAYAEQQLKLHAEEGRQAAEATIAAAVASSKARNYPPEMQAKLDAEIANLRQWLAAKDDDWMAQFGHEDARNLIQMYRAAMARK